MLAVLVSALALFASATPASPSGATVVQPQQFQVFVRPWPQHAQPLCAVIDSDAAWRRVFAPAAVGFGNKPFAPPPSWWNTHALLVVARTSAMSSAPVLRADALSHDASSLAIRYTFVPPPPASSTMNTWIGLAVAKPIPHRVSFFENGRHVCSGRL